MHTAENNQVNNNPLISVIVPFYKVDEKYSKKCFDSILSQSYKNFELLIIDDGSGSEYELFLSSVAAADNRVRLIKKENGGVSSARNLGIDEAHGDYIAFVDSDDTVQTNYLETLLNAIKRYHSDICICEFVDANKTLMKAETCDKEYFFSTPSFHCTHRHISNPVNKLYLRKIMQSNGIKFDTSLHLGEDTVFVLDYLSHCTTISIINDALYSVTYRPGSAGRQGQKRYWDDEVQAIDKAFGLFSSHIKSKEEKHFLSYAMYLRLIEASNYYLTWFKDKNYINKMLQIIGASRISDYVLDDFASNEFLKKDKCGYLLAKLQEKPIYVLRKIYKKKRVKLKNFLSCFYHNNKEKHPRLFSVLKSFYYKTSQFQ